MNISHWGIVPGWFVPLSNRIGEQRMRWEAIDFDTYLLGIQAAEQVALDPALAEREALRRRRNAFLN